MTHPERPAGRRVARVLALALLVLPACSGVGNREPVPQVMRDYLEAVKDKRYEDAYKLTRLDEIQGRFGRGAALTLEHFAAFHDATPLLDYEVKDVFRLDRRSINSPRQPGTPQYEVDVELEYADGTRERAFSVFGDVLPKVTVDPDRLFVELPRPTRSVMVDGVATDVSNGQRSGTTSTYQLLLLSGRHSISVGEHTVTMTTDPLVVLDGAGRIEGEGHRRLVIGG